MTTDQPFNDRDRLRTLLEAYGADPARWPPADRARFAGRLEQADGALLADAHALDRLLAEAGEPETPAGSLERLMARLPAGVPAGVKPPGDGFAPAASGRRSRWMLAGPAMALAASLLLGLWIGSAGMVDGLLLDGNGEGDWNAIAIAEDGDVT